MKLLKLLLVPLALICVALVRLLDKCGILIRFGEFWSPRIGHLAANTECYLCERDAGMHKGIDIWTHRGPISNRYLAKMWRRCMLIDPTRFTLIVLLVNKMFQGWQKHVVMPQQFDRDIGNLFEKQKPHLKFTPEEETRGERELRRMGIPKGAKWVCLIVRDSAYLPHLLYHSYRDTDIKDYLFAALELTSRGYYVIRMGAVVAKPFLVKHTKIIDYATNGMRSEFMDIYLGAKCEFCVSTGTGFDAIPYIFRRPICYVNFVPVEYLFTFAQKSLAIWKHHIKDGKRMTLAEIFESRAGQFMAAHDFAAQGITLQDNSPEEISQAVREMHEYLTERPWPRQFEFWRQFPKSVSPFNGRPLHGEMRMRIGREFLKQYDVPTSTRMMP